MAVSAWPVSHTPSACRYSRGSAPYHRGLWSRVALLTDARARKRLQVATCERATCDEPQQPPQLLGRPQRRQPPAAGAPDSVSEAETVHRVSAPDLQRLEALLWQEHSSDSNHSAATEPAASLETQQATGLSGKPQHDFPRRQAPDSGTAASHSGRPDQQADRHAQPQHVAYPYPIRVGHDCQEADIAQVLLQLPPDACIAPIFGNMRLTGKQIMRILSPLSDAGAYDMALRTFEWLDAQEQHATRDCYVYTRMMSMFARQQDTCAQALDIFDRMKAVGIEPDLRAYNTAIRAAGKGLQWERVEQLSADMEAQGLHADVYTYSLLISACQACGNRWQRALQLFADMEHAGVVPNVITYTTLMSVCQRAGQWQRAMQIFQKMEMDHVQADVVACNAAMTACAKGGCWERAWAVFSGMRRMQVQPSTVSYNALISACERCGQAERALEVFRIMEREAGNSGGALRPSAVTFNTLISACGKAGKYDEAVELCHKMRANGLQPDVFTMCGLINACERVGLGEEALQTFESFCAEGVAPNTIAFNSVINALGTSQRLQQALQLFGRMQAAEGAAPDVITYASLISACAKCGEWEKALRLYEDMQAARIRPNSYIFHALLHACEAGSQWGRAVEVFQALEALDEAEAEAGSLAMRSRRVLYAFPSLVAAMPQVLTAARLAVESGRAARRWISRSKEE